MSADTGFTPLDNIESAQTVEPTPPPLQHTQGNVPIIVGIFWGVLGFIIIILCCFILRHLSRRRAQLLEEQAVWQRQQSLAQQARRQERIGSQKPPGPIPIVVVLPDNEVAFGWEVPLPREDSLDSVDLKPEKECSSCSCGGISPDYKGCPVCRDNDTTLDSPV